MKYTKLPNKYNFLNGKYISNIHIAIILFILVLTLKSPVLNLPYHSDALSSYVPTAVWMKDNGFNPFSLGFANSYGHPPLFFQTLALAFFLFGTKLFVAHLLIIIFSFLAIFFTYLIGEYLYGKKVGIFAALFLLFDPLFFAQSGMVQISVPFTALTMVSVYFALRNKTAFYLFAASCLVLFKEPAIFTISIITLYKYLEKDKRWFITSLFVFFLDFFE